MFRAHGFERSVLCSVESDAPGAVPAGNGQGVDLEAFLLELEMIKSKRNLSINYIIDKEFSHVFTHKVEALRQAKLNSTSTNTPGVARCLHKDTDLTCGKKPSDVGLHVCNDTV